MPKWIRRSRAVLPKKSRLFHFEEEKNQWPTKHKLLQGSTIPLVPRINQRREKRFLQPIRPAQRKNRPQLLFAERTQFQHGGLRRFRTICLTRPIENLSQHFSVVSEGQEPWTVKFSQGVTGARVSLRYHSIVLSRPSSKDVRALH